MMKKITYTALALFGLASICSASITVSYLTNTGVLFDESNSALAADSLFAAYWSEDDSTDGFTASDVLNPNGDTFLGVYSTSDAFAIDGMISGNLSVTYDDTYLEGFIYIAVFNTSYTDYDGSIADGTYYGLGDTLGSLSALNPNDYGGTIVSLTTDIQAIPEPATMLIFGPGIAGLLGYRRRKDSLRGQLRALFERRQACIKARKAKVGSERELIDPLTLLNKLFVKREHKRFDLLGDLLMAVDARFSK